MPAFIYALTKDTCRCILKKALYIPTFKQNIFSVQVATKNGEHISFKRENSLLIYPNGGARGVMVIVVGNGHGDLSSNPGRE